MKSTPRATNSGAVTITKFVWDSLEVIVKELYNILTPLVKTLQNLPTGAGNLKKPRRVKNITTPFFETPTGGMELAFGSCRKQQPTKIVRLAHDTGAE